MLTDCPLFLAGLKSRWVFPAEFPTATQIPKLLKEGSRGTNAGWPMEVFFLFNKKNLGGGFIHIFHFHPYFGEDSDFD